jgi:hypothetical protein
MAVVLSNAFKSKLTSIEDRMYRWDISPYIIEETIDRIQRTQQFSLLEFLVFNNTHLKHKEITKLGKYVAGKFFLHKNEGPDKGLRYVYMNNVPMSMSFLLKKKAVYVYNYEDWDFVLEAIRSYT